MSRYQIKVLDGDLSDLVHELSMRVTRRSEHPVREAPEKAVTYADVFRAVREVLKGFVRGFHVCGCSRHCDLGSRPTELRATHHSKQAFERLPIDSMRIHPSRVHRYVLALDIPLREFVKRVEVAVFQTMERHPEEGRSRAVLFRWIREHVLLVLGKYLYFCPECNSGSDLCELGVCTEFDPWEGVEPRQVEPAQRVIA